MANDDKTPVGIITYDEKRANIPSAELEPVLHEQHRKPIRTAWDRRNRDLDPQLVWRGKDPDQAELTVDAPPIYLQEQVHPKALVDDLRNGREKADDLFGHFGLTEEDREAEVEFYRHTRKWSNRMILGDGLQVMASLAEREGLKGQVQAIYIDPPYGIRFNSNFQWSTTSRDVKDGKLDHLTREPEQVKAFRDTWRNGIHSYLSYLRDRLTVARELLTDSGSCFVQIGDENVHRVRALMDEVFGEANFCLEIVLLKSGAQSADAMAGVSDFILWYSKKRESMKARRQYFDADPFENPSERYICVETPNGNLIDLSYKQKTREHPIPEGRVVRLWPTFSQSKSSTTDYSLNFQGMKFRPASNYGWRSPATGMRRVERAEKLYPIGKSLRIKNYFDQFPLKLANNVWSDLRPGGFGVDRTYVVQTDTRVVQRCLLMTTDPGDLVLDPTCGSGTTAYVAEQWGRRWITIDTSRVALALARARVMGAKYPWYLLADSPEGQKKLAEVTRSAPSTQLTYGDIRHGFVYERVPHITLKSIANNTEIDVIWDRMQPAVEAARAALNAALAGYAVPFKVETGGRAGKAIDFIATGTVPLPSSDEAPANGFMEWEVPREAPEGWPQTARDALEIFWQARIARQKEIDASIAAKAAKDDFENLYDKPYEDRKRIRVAGPFTVESLSPHAISAVDEHGELIDALNASEGLQGDHGESCQGRRPSVRQSGRDPLRRPDAMAGRVDRCRGQLPRG
jgi:adenine-specific DNA-methyltransferase